MVRTICVIFSTRSLIFQFILCIESIDPSETLPSSLAISGDCQDTGFKVEGFDTITFCALDGSVYLNGRNTCNVFS